MWVLHLLLGEQVDVFDPGQESQEGGDVAVGVGGGRGRHVDGVREDAAEQNSGDLAEGRADGEGPTSAGEPTRRKGRDGERGSGCHPRQAAPPAGSACRAG